MHIVTYHNVGKCLRYSSELQKWAKITNVHIITSVNDQKQENEVKKKQSLFAFLLLLLLLLQFKEKRGAAVFSLIATKTTTNILVVWFLVTD